MRDPSFLAQIPGVVTCQVDMTPVQRRQIAELVIGNLSAFNFKVVNNCREIRRIPQGNSCDDEIKSTRLMQLRF